MNLADNRYPTLSVEIIQQSNDHLGGGSLALVANKPSGLVPFEKPSAFKIVEHVLAHLLRDVKLLRKPLDAPRSLRIASQQEQRFQLGHRLDLLSDKVANVNGQGIVQGFFVEGRYRRRIRGASVNARAGRRRRRCRFLPGRTSRRSLQRFVSDRFHRRDQFSEVNRFGKILLHPG